MTLPHASDKRAMNGGEMPPALAVPGAGRDARMALVQRVRTRAFPVSAGIGV